MNERDDLGELLRAVYERQAQALESQLDRRLSRVLGVTQQRAARRLLKPALALVGLAAIFGSAWLYDLSQAGDSAGLVVLEAQYDRPKVVLREPGDPVRLTQQIAGVSEQAPTPYFVEPGPTTGVFRSPTEMDIQVGIADDKGNRFLVVDSQIVKRTPEGESSVIRDDLDEPSALAFDSEGHLLVLESGKGRIVRVQAIAGEIKSGSSVSVFAEGFAGSATSREGLSTQMMREEGLESQPRESVWPVYLTVNEAGEIFVGGRAAGGEAVVYKIGRKSFKWWKFYCLYQC
jgi:hypothetical protein